MTSDERHSRAMLRRAGLRATRPRLALAGLIFSAPRHRHVTAESLHREAQGAGISVPLTTVYNTLHQLTEVGLLREIIVDPRRSYFDTNTDTHHHFFFEEDGRLEDIPAESMPLPHLPASPPGTRVERVDVIVRVRREATPRPPRGTAD